MLNLFPFQQQQRFAVKIETLTGTTNLHQRLSQLLGPEYDSTLKLEGIDYHHPSWCIGDDSSVYFLASNDHEVVGLLKYLSHPHSNGLAFIAVAPGFRHRGLSIQIYQHFIDECINNHKILSRTDPGTFTEQHPEITKSYNKLCLFNPVLHVPGSLGSGRFYFELQKVLAQNLSQAYHSLFPQLKALCDSATLETWSRNFTSISQIDEEYAQKVLALSPELGEPSSRSTPLKISL